MILHSLGADSSTLLLPFKTFYSSSPRKMDTIKYLLEQSHPDLAKILEFGLNLNISFDNSSIDSINLLNYESKQESNQILLRSELVQAEDLVFQIKNKTKKEPMMQFEKISENQCASCISFLPEILKKTTDTSVDGSRFEIIFLVDR